eukprot:GHVS01027636.1.p1 GENE.GHVS01027636.1~~GHVS01027636.1.p1  ORF type:complete len:158 (+),score=10.00 GHVS01027636.1:415-888(+)
MTLPGWQAVETRLNEDARLTRLRLERLCSLVRSNMLRDEQLRRAKEDDFHVGDIVVYHMSEYERRKEVEPLDDGDSRKYGPQWSLPVREVSERTLKVRHTLGGRKDFRVVPNSKVRRVVGAVPDSLVGQTYRNLGVELPKAPSGLRRLPFEDPTATP